MHQRLGLGVLLLGIACRGGPIEPDFGGANPPPTSKPALGFRFGGSGAELLTGMVSDPAGNIYLTGTFTGTTDLDPGAGVAAFTSLGGTDVFLAKYTDAGALVWASRIGGPGAQRVTSLARDASGNLYIGGGFEGSIVFDPGPFMQALNSAGGQDGFVAKYSSDGDLIWARRFGGSGGDEVAGVALDGAGNLYAVGSFAGQANAAPIPGPTILSDGNAADGFMVSFDPGGAVRWALPIGGNQADAASAVAATNDGRVTVAGTFRGSADFARNAAQVRLTAQGGTDEFLASYTSGGQLQWARDLGGSNGEVAAGGGLAFDGQGGAVLLGSFSGSVDFDPGPAVVSRVSVGPLDLFLARYDADGTFASVMTLGGTLGSLTGVRVITDMDGSALVTGSFAGSVDFDPGAGIHTLASLGTGGATDGFVARFSVVGTLVWVSRFGQVTSASDRANSGTALTVDPFEDVIVGGRFFGIPDFDPGSGDFRLITAGDADAFVVKLTSTGALLLAP